MTVESFSVDGVDFRKNDQTMAAPGDTEPLRLTHEVCVQIAGTATAINATVLRSPDGASDNYSPAGDVLSGNPAAGMNIKRYAEPSESFWKVRVNSITGSAKVHISGQSAQ